MLDQEIERLYVRGIVVECSEKDANRAELDNLQLIFISEKDHCLNLVRYPRSRTTWVQTNRDKIPVPAKAFLLVATSDRLGHIGFVQIDLGQLSDKKGESGRMETIHGEVRTLGVQDEFYSRRVFKFEPLSDSAELSVAFHVYSSAQDRRQKNKGAKAEADITHPDVLDLSSQLRPEDDPDKASLLNMMGDKFLQRFEITQESRDIEAAIEAYDQALALLSGDDGRVATFLDDIGSAYFYSYETFGRLEDIDESIRKREIAKAITPEGHEDLPRFLNNLCVSYQSRFERNGKMADNAEAMRVQHQAVNLTPEGHSELPSRLNNLGGLLFLRFERAGDFTDISEAIRVQQQAVNLTPEGHSDLPSLLNKLGNSFSQRFKRGGDLADISEAIRVQHQAVNLTPEGHSELPSRLNNLGGLLFLRFERAGDFTDISEAIRVQQQAVNLTPEGHSDLPSLLNNLGNSFSQRFKRGGDFADISEAIRVQQQAVNLMPEGHSELPTLLSNLGNSLLGHFERAGDLTDISEAIRVQQQAVNLTPEGHSNLLRRLSNLGNSLSRRFERVRDLTDISEAIRVHQQAVNLTSEGHSDLPSLLNNLGGSLLRRFEQAADLADISEAIRIQQQAIDLTPEGHSDFPSLLNNLGNSFSQRFKRGGDLADISQAIRVQQQAVNLTPEGHSELPSLLTSLGNSFSLRFEQAEDLTDISEAIRVQQQAVNLTPEGHSDLPSWLNNLGTSFLRRFQRAGDFGDFYGLIATSKSSAMAITGPPSIRIHTAKIWAKFSSFISMSEALNGYGRIMELLLELAGFENTLERRHDLLLNTSRLSTAAAAAALSANQFSTALEWLEEGRCIVWNQINQLRTPVDDLRRHNGVLADRLTTLSRQLENAGARMDPRHPDIDLPMAMKISLQDEAHNHLMLAKERDEVLAAVRLLPGFNDFLRPRTCADLMRELPEDGPVIIINAAEDRCDALALFAGCDEPIHIPLPNFSYEKATNLANGLREYLSFHQLRARYSERPGITSDSRGMRREIASSEDGIHGILRALWADLVEPILQSLDMKVEDDDTDLPRIWWCPTGPLAFLPLHAAGVYTKEGMTEKCCLADFAISSYIPNLSILKKLRSRTPTKTHDKILLVSQPHTPGLPPISCTKLEVQKAGAELKRRKIKSDVYEGEKATVAMISKALESYSCIHLACHASQKVESPLESAVYLHDGPLKLREIIKKDLPHAELAFMSACQTGTGVEKLPEEAVHLAAGMLAVGYRSVIATMWSIADKHAPDVAETFYKCLLNEETAEGTVKLDVTGSARALHIATQALRRSLRDTEEGLLAWIPYVHYGI